MNDVVQEEEPEVKVPKLEIPDLRQILKRQEEPRATGLFSAPDFIALEGDEAEPQKLHEGAHEGDDNDEVDTGKAVTGTINEQAQLPADMASDDLT